MAEETREQLEGRTRSGWNALAASVLFALGAGAGGFFAVHSGALPLRSLWDRVVGGQPPVGDAAEAAVGQANAERLGSYQSAGYQPGAYVHLDPILVSLDPQSRSEHLKVSLVVEVAPGREGEIEAAKPRLLDVLNVFLRAVDEREFELPQSMERLRAQMLRRVQLVSPEGAVRDVLIQEFVIN